MEKQKEYYAFISYKREDEKWAKWLQDKLEHYKFPANLNGRSDLPKNIRPTFRDVTDLNPGLLAEEINNALCNSEWLIVICSPRSAKSPWVCKEAQAFIDLGRADHIIPYVIEGNPFSDDISTECYPEALLNLTGNKELLAANINEMGRDAATIKVVARMFNLRFDALWQRYERERKRIRRFWVGIAIVFSLVCLGIGSYFIMQNRIITNQKIILTRNQCRAVAEKAMREIAKGNVKDAMIALLMVSPDNNDYSYIPEVEAALRCALDSLNSSGYNYQLIRGNVDCLLVNDSCNRIVHVLKDKTLECYDSATLQCIKRMKLPNTNFFNVYLSGNGRAILLQDSSYVYCYDIDSSKEIFKTSTSNLSVAQFNNLKDKFLSKSYTINGSFLERNICVVRQEFKYCKFYNYKKGIALFYTEFNEDSASLESVNPIGKYILYDIINNIPLFEKYDYELYENDYQITSIKLSPNGSFLATAYVNGDIEVFDVESRDVRVWKHSDVGGHYSNTIQFSKDSRWLFQAHAFQDCINILDVNNLYLQDSIKTEDSPEGAIVYMLNKNDILCCSSNRTFLYSKGKQCLETRYSEGKYDIDEVRMCIGIKDEKGKHTYKVRKLDFAKSNSNNKNFEFATNQTIIEESDGFSLLDNRTNKVIWKHNNIVETAPIAYSSNWRYGFIHNGAYRGGDYISILEMSSGIPMINCLCSSIDDIFYAEKEGLIFIKDFSDLIVKKFPLYDKLLIECQEITKGMCLSENKKRSFFLE